MKLVSVFTSSLARKFFCVGGTLLLFVLGAVAAPEQVPLLATTQVDTAIHHVFVTLTNNTDKVVVAYQMRTTEYVQGSDSPVQRLNIAYDELYYDANPDIRYQDRNASTASQQFIYPGHPHTIALPTTEATYRLAVEVTSVIFIDRTWWGNKTEVDRFFSQRVQTAQKLLKAADLIAGSTPETEEQTLKDLRALHSGSLEATLSKGLVNVSPDDLKRRAQWWLDQSKEVAQ